MTIELKIGNETYTLRSVDLVQDGDSDKVYISKKFNNGDFDYYLAIVVRDLFELGLVTINDDPDMDDDDRYGIDILAISPYINHDLSRKLISDWGNGEDDSYINDPVNQCLALIEYGKCATLFSMDCSFLEVGLVKMDEMINSINALFGFFMDKPQNQIGDDGWVFIGYGESVMSKYRKEISEDK